MTQEQIIKEDRFIYLKKLIEESKKEMDEIKQSFITDLDLEPDMEFDKITLYKIAPTRKTNWKAIVEEIKPDRWIIEDNTTTTAGSYGIKLKK